MLIAPGSFLFSGNYRKNIMFSKLSKLLVSVFGSRNERVVKTYMNTAISAGEFESQMKQLSDEQIKGYTAGFKEKINSGTKAETLLPEAFALVREAARRNMSMRHYDVQLVGGNVLFEGKIAEMATGEGKTLVATLAAYLVHLTGKRIHVITVNDYLAKRDCEWMRPVFESLGLTVGAIQSGMNPGGNERKDMYSRDITYGTNNEFGFDYLRDNMKMNAEQLAQGELEFALVDEVDSILIDEARTPLIISGPAFDDITRYKKSDVVVKGLMSLQSKYDNVKSKIDLAEKEIAAAEGEINEAGKDKERAKKARDVADKVKTEKEQLEEELENTIQYYEVEYDRKSVHLTHEGTGSAQDLAGVGSFFTGTNMDWPHLIEQGLRARICFEKEKDYVVIDGKIVIVDEFTGRLMEGRQWSDGLHQAIEAKENVQIKEETQTLATITLQNFFKLYDQIAGMTGTAMTEAQEFSDIYGLDTIAIPTNKPCVRDDRDDLIYKSMRDKFGAIVESIRETSQKGCPILVGTVSIEKSEAISNALLRKYGIEHEVLNAKQHAREASIVEKAGFTHTGRDGKQWGNVTIATNMAGRGTDIKLGEGVADRGGLCIIGTERHESRRIDNQLRGRAGRQGDNGASQFFLSFDDDLLAIFSPDWTVKALTRTGWQEGEPVFHPWISRGIEKAQKKVEEKNYEARKSLLEYDEVMDYQRKIFYTRRRKVLKGIGLRETIEDMMSDVVLDNCKSILNTDYPRNCIVEWARSNFNTDITFKAIKESSVEEIEKHIKKNTKKDVESEISIALGEYLEDYEDKSTWKMDKLSKWIMSSYSADVSVSKLNKLDAEQIQEMITEAACEQVENKDCSIIADFLSKGFAERNFIDAINTRFALTLTVDQIKDRETEDIHGEIFSLLTEKYNTKEIEYPVDFALGMVFTQQGINSYGYEMLVKWAQSRYGLNLTVEDIQNTHPSDLRKKLLTAAKHTFENFEQEINDKVENFEPKQFSEWLKERYHIELAEVLLDDMEKVRENCVNIVRSLLRNELSRLEKYVLLQIYDSAWKDHLYAMDRLKESIFLRSFAEKDPKVEYKREGYKMFEEMLSSVQHRVTDTVFKVRLAANEQTKDVYSGQNASHDEAKQFAQTETQRAAAMAPQKSSPAQPIVNKRPKVGRNDPCPCGSGKKYKKCCEN